MASIVSLEIGRPLQIDDDDCDVSEPTPVDDECIRPTGISLPTPGQFAPNGLVAVIPVVRMAAQMKKTLKARTIAASTLNTYDEHFRTIMASYPEPFPIASQAYLDPRLLTAACGLQTNRFFLYRHNLSAGCRKADRVDALDRCVDVAQATAHYVQRSMQSGGGSSSGAGYYSPTHMASWAARLRTMSPAFFCAHLWRCTLVLCLRMEYAAALTLVQASAAVGDLRKNNIALGRYLAFFLDKLIGRLRAGATKQSLEIDEEMLAYVGGDMQGSIEEAWAWTGSPTGATLQEQANVNGFVGEGTTSAAIDPALSGPLSDREMHEWGGWDHIQRTLEQLLQAQSGPPPPPPAQMSPFPPPAAASPYPPPPSQPQAPQQNLAPYPPPPGHSSVSPAPSNGGSSRISIRDIM